MFPAKHETIRGMILGDATRREFLPFVKALTSRLTDAGLSFCRDLTNVEHWLNKHPAPALVAVLQSWPDEFPAEHVQRLLTWMPLSRLFCVSGFWCEAVGRTRKHWPPGLRIPVWAAEERLDYELSVLQGVAHSIPWTAGRDDVLLATSSRDVPAEQVAATGVESNKRDKTVRFAWFDPALMRLLCEHFDAAGWTIVTDSRAPSRFVIVQTEPISTVLVDQLAASCQALAPATVVGLTSWPAPGWTAQLFDAGVQVLFQPLAGETLPAFLARWTLESEH